MATVYHEMKLLKQKISGAVTVKVEMHRTQNKRKWTRISDRIGYIRETKQLRN